MRAARVHRDSALGKYNYFGRYKLSPVERLGLARPAFAILTERVRLVLISL